MATGSVNVTVRVRDMDRTRLFVHELTTLSDEMRVMPSPHSARLEHALARYIGGGDDEGEGELTDAIEETEVIYDPCPKCGYVEEGE